MVKPKSLIAPNDSKPPSRDDMFKIMSDLRIAYDNDPTLERSWMLQMSRYIFHVVGEWQESVTQAQGNLKEAVEMVDLKMGSIYNEMRDRANNQEQSVRLCLSVANRFFPEKSTAAQGA